MSVPTAVSGVSSAKAHRNPRFHKRACTINERGPDAGLPPLIRQRLLSQQRIGVDVCTLKIAFRIGENGDREV